MLQLLILNAMNFVVIHYRGSLTQVQSINYIYFIFIYFSRAMIQRTKFTLLQQLLRETFYPLVNTNKIFTTTHDVAVGGGYIVLLKTNYPIAMRRLTAMELPPSYRHRFLTRSVKAAE